MNREPQNSSLLPEFVSCITDIHHAVNDITHREEAKADAAASHSHSKMSGLIQQEQAQILKLRGLEQRRHQLAAALLWDGLTFQQILQAVPDSHKGQLDALFTELKLQLRHLTSARDTADQIIRLRLQEFTESLSAMGDNTGPHHLHDRYV